MAIQIIPHSAERSAAVKEFNQRMKEGYFAADITDGKNEIVDTFSPDADQSHGTRDRATSPTCQSPTLTTSGR